MAFLVISSPRSLVRLAARSRSLRTICAWLTSSADLIAWQSDLPLSVSLILADRLSKLELGGMITRHTDQAKKSKICYLPTPKARALLPAFLHMMVWSTVYDEATEAPASFAAAFRENPEATLAWYEAEIDRVNETVGQARTPS